MSCFISVDNDIGVICLVTTNTMSRGDDLIHLSSRVSDWRDSSVRKWLATQA